MFEIKKGVPMPSRRMGIYNFAAMEVGDSFFAPRDMGKLKGGCDKRQNAINACARLWAARNNPEAKFSVRLIDENTVGCWRVK